MIAQEPIHPGGGQARGEHAHGRREIQWQQEKKAWQLDLQVEFGRLDQVGKGKCQQNRRCEHTDPVRVWQIPLFIHVCIVPVSEGGEKEGVAVFCPRDMRVSTIFDLHPDSLEKQAYLWLKALNLQQFGCRGRVNMVESTGYEQAELGRTPPTARCDGFIKTWF